MIEPDCIIVSHITNYIPTADEMASRRRVLDERQIPLSSVKENVLSKYSKLNDDSGYFLTHFGKNLVSKHKAYII